MRNFTKYNVALARLATQKCLVNNKKGWKTNFSYNGNLIALRRTDNPKPVMVEVGTGAFGNIGKPTSGYISNFSNTNYALYNVVSSYGRQIRSDFDPVGKRCRTC